MIYLYRCAPCAKELDVVKSVVDFDREEPCAACGTTMKRMVTRGRVYLSGTAVQEKRWQPALGRALTDREMRQEARDRGWVELGNERAEKHLKPELAEYPNFSKDEVEQLLRKES